VKKKLFQISVLVIVFGLILSGCLGGVLGSELSSTPNATVTGNSKWTLLVNGAVYHPINLTFNELIAMPNITEYAELYCYSELIVSGNWTGVRLGVLLSKAGLYPNATTLEFYASDGYTIKLPITDAMQGNAIIAYQLNGTVPLDYTAVNGQRNETLQLVLPRDRNGFEWIYLITRIEVIAATPTPEFPSALVLAIFLPLIVLAVVFLRRKLGRPKAGAFFTFSQPARSIACIVAFVLG